MKTHVSNNSRIRQYFPLLLGIAVSAVSLIVVPQSSAQTTAPNPCPLPQELNSPVTFTVFTDNRPCPVSDAVFEAYFKIVIGDRNYRGWCSDSLLDIHSACNFPPAAPQPYTGQVIDSLRLLCPNQEVAGISPYIYQPNGLFPALGSCVWNKINWVINNKGNANPDTIQWVLWMLISPPQQDDLDTIPTADTTTVGPALLAAADQQAGFAPGPGNVRAAVLYVADDVQFVFIEIPCCPPPSISCPNDLAVECGESIDPAATGTAAATPYCGRTVEISHSDVEITGNCVEKVVKTIVRTWTAKDSAGGISTCTQRITVRDTTAPLAPVAPKDVTGQCDGDVPPAAPLIAKDKCNGEISGSPTDTKVPHTGDCGYTITRTWTFTDACGNSSSASQKIQIQDTTPPVIACSKDIETCDQNVDVPDATATDNCDSNVHVYCVRSDDAKLKLSDPYPVGQTTITCIATDSCGNTASCTVKIIVKTTEQCTPFGGCRVTGGSNKQDNTYQSANIKTAAPKFVSHGGQVGASLSEGTPFRPYSPCISGEWEHNRHLTQKSLVGVLHASGNGNVRQFDSLLCACLPCDASPGAKGVVGRVCNPDDKICGPLPRKAPANKICFSGVGDYTLDNGKKTVKAVFRVDIEDRSEGNSQASQPPADRYRIRLWLLGKDFGRDFAPDSVQGLALRLAASADPTKIANLATTEDLKNPIAAGLPDIDDGGDMTQGNHQIHPETGATCKD